MHQNIRKINLSRFFHNLIFAYVIERLFWQTRGITPLMVVYTEFVYSVVITVFEIPTGIMADRFSKKRILIIADTLTIAELIIIVFAHSFIAFAIAVAIAGISTAMRSGTERALLYESLKSQDDQALFEKQVGILNAYDFSAGSIAALFGGFMANSHGFELNYYLSIVSAVIALIITITLTDISSDVNISSKNRKSTILGKSIEAFKQKPVLILMVLLYCFIGAAVVYADEFWELYLNDFSISVLYFGLFSVAISISRIIGSLLADKLIKYISHLKIALWMILFMSALLICILAVNIYLGMTLLIIVFMIDGLVEPIITGYLHHRIPSDVRVTMDSFLSLSMRMVIVPVGIGFGLIVTNTSTKIGFGYLGAVLLMLIPVYLKLYSKLKR